MIKEIKIENFRGIRKGGLKDLTEVNLLVGQNNSGKSTILDALILVKSPLKPIDRLGRSIENLQKRRVSRASFSLTSFHYKLAAENTIEIDLQFQDQEEVKSRVVVQDTNLKFDFNGSQIVISSTGKVPSGTFRVPLGEENQKCLEELLLIDAEYIRRLDLVEERLWGEIFEKRADKGIKEALNEAYELDIEGFTFPKPERSPLYIQMPEYSIPVDALGEGFRYALAILSTAALLKKTALLIEELEVHQHPDSLEKLLTALFKLARRNEIQLFISTQSSELISKALEIAEKYDLNFKIYHLILDKEGLLKTRELTSPDAKLLSEIGPDVRMLHKYAKV